MATVTRRDDGRLELVAWNLDRGRMRVSVEAARNLLGWTTPAREGDRVLVLWRPFTGLENDWLRAEYTLVAQDSAWWAYWMAAQLLARLRWRSLSAWCRWLYRTGRMEPAMEGQIKRVEDLWVRTWWPRRWWLG